MQELSLNILDIAQNSIVANATLIEIGVEVDEKDFLAITIRDNGKGMDEESVKNVINPFFTSSCSISDSSFLSFSYHIAKNAGIITTAITKNCHQSLESSICIYFYPFC